MTLKRGPVKSALAVLIVAASVTACGMDDCTLLLTPGIVVQVRDSVTNESIPGATVIATTGVYTDSVESPGNATVRLADEQTGRYAVRVRKAGYRLWSLAPVDVYRDQCHVRTVELVARLQPE